MKYRIQENAHYNDIDFRIYDGDTTPLSELIIWWEYNTNDLNTIGRMDVNYGKEEQKIKKLLILFCALNRIK